jgi:hypothetical protein
MAKPAGLWQNDALATKQTVKGAQVGYPLSRDEHAAMARCLAGITKQLSDVSDLFTARYGTDSRIAERAVQAAASASLLQDELLFEHDMVSVEAQVQSVGTTP